LTTDSDLLVLSVEKDLASPPDPGRPYPASWEFSRLYLEADGYAAVQSEPIPFDEDWADEYNRANQVEIEFPNVPSVIESRGTTREIEIILREPGERYLCFVDDDRKPVAGFKVSTYLYFSRSNHCAVPMGERLLAEGTSGRDGCLVVPDGQFEYRFDFESGPYERAGFDFLENGGPWELVSYLSDRVTVISLHKWRKQPLEMFVTRDGVPAVNETLAGWHVACTCWCGDEPIAETDKNGRISLREFYPEEWESVSIFFGPQIGKVWEADPKRFPIDQVIRVDWNE
jgi:hypothetical protein